MSLKNINILFFGTSEFAVPALEKLIDHNYSIIAIVTQPDKPFGRKQILTPPPVKILAAKHNLKILQPENFLDFASNLLTFDLIITASYGKIIPRDILDMAAFGALNIHPSLLPKYRGPSPLQVTILNGDKETGVTIMMMDKKMDHGPILTQEKFSIASLFPEAKPTFINLHNKLAEKGASLLIDTIPKFIAHEITPAPQDEAFSSYTKIITKDDGKINWTKSAVEIERQIRALTPWPGCWTIFNNKRIKIITAAAKSETDAFSTAAPGKIFKTDKTKMVVKCGAGSLEIREIQMEGKKPSTGEIFLNGYPDTIGKHF